MKHERHKCGCVSERGSGRERWTALCQTHQAEAAEIHKRHADDMRAKRESEEA